MTGTAGEERPEPLMREALDLFGEYQRTGDQPPLARAVPVFRAALAAAVRCGVPDIASYHNNLGYALHEFATATSDAAAQAEGVRCHRAAVAAAADDVDRVPYLCSLSSGLRALYGHTGEAALLGEAVATATEALELPGLEPNMAVQHAVLAGALEDLYTHEPDPAVLTELIGAYQKAASYGDLVDDPGTAAHWNSVGSWLRERYERTGDLGALTEGIRFTRKAVAAASGENRLSYLSNLGDKLRLRFERTDDLDALTESVAANRMSVAGTWPGHPGLPLRANNLAGALSCWYRRTGDTAALAEAMTAARQAVAASAPGDEGRGGYLNNLQIVLHLEWERTGVFAALAESVRVARTAVAAAPPGHPLRALCLGALAGAVSELYERTGNDDLLTEYVQADRDALRAIPDGHPDRAASLHNLGQALSTLYGRTGDTAALDEAVRAARAAIAVTPADDRALALRLGGLSSLLLSLVERTGDDGPLTEAVSAARAAVAAIAPDDPDRAIVLDDLGATLTSLFLRTKNSAMLVEAVRARREALAATPEGHLSRIDRLVNLAGSVQTLAVRTDDGTATIEAAGLIEDALEALPEDHPDRALCLYRLARIHRRLARIYPETADWDLDDAIGFARESLAATPVDHPDHTERLGTLAGLLLLRSHEGQEPETLPEALQLARQAASAAAPDHPGYASHQDQLGLALFWRHRAAARAGGDAAAAAQAWQCFHEAAIQPLAPAGVRIGAYRRAAEIAGEAGRTVQEALACMEAAVDLLPKVLPGQLTRADQEHEIGSVSGLAAHAAQAAVAAGRPDRAVELLERTRGVLVASELDRRAGHDHNAPLTVPELGAIAADGPVVYVYASVLHCAALVLVPTADSASSDHVRHVPLDVADADVWDKAERLMILVGLQPDGEERDNADPAVQQEFLAIIGWLRERVTGPVLAALGYDRWPAGECGRPRIWWCPVGVFAFFPLHAACLDEVVSSYALTARSLRYARSQPSLTAENASEPLIVAVPSAPGVPPLPGARLEADLIVGLFPHAARLTRPTGKAVLAALPDHPVAHFACHGSVDPDEPGRSRLFLEDYALAPLTVADIGELRLAGGLAFLSACETAVTTYNLANEAVHLTGAFQLAGYQHVVGTLWQVNDRTSARLVRDFYAALTVPDHQGLISVPLAAVALHHATRRLRDRYPNWPTLWAGYIHTGP